MTRSAENSPQLLAETTGPANRTSAFLAAVAVVALAGNCLLTSPPRFSDAHAKDRSLLKPVVALLGFNAAFPTARGVEIRNLVFYTAAAALALIGGLHLLTTSRRPPISLDDVWDIRRRATGPVFWLVLLLLVSVISTSFSHAPRELMGQTIIRALHLAWWLPLALLLTPSHARRVMIALLTILALSAALASWYHVERGVPNQRLGYPFGNELFLAACLLPGVFLAAGLIPYGLRASSWRRPMIIVGLAVACALFAWTLYLTGSRSALVGVGAGAFVLACLAPPKRVRPAIFVVALVLAIAGAGLVRSIRPHSIRARLDHEWPYALVMFYQKIVVGHGDGAYSLLAGRIGRQDQLGDPSVMAFDERSWIAHAHNEFLETLADLGAVGCIALVGAVIVTLVYALRFVSSTERTNDPNRWPAIGLASALVAVFVDQCFEPALRVPGLAPILLTCWALLWAVVRGQRPPAEPAPEQDRLSISAVRVAGALACVAAVCLGYFGIRDWQGVRARFDAEVALREGRLDAAVDRADFAARNTLAPFRQMIPRTFAVQARILAFERALADDDRPPTDAEINLARDALRRIGRIEQAAPRFLGVSQMQVAICGDLVQTYHRRNAPQDENYFVRSLVAAVERWRADEPFQSAPVVRLWQLRADAPVTTRILWLRCLMRGGEVDDAFRPLFGQLARHPDFARALDDLLNIAAEDRERSPESWQDPLSPETYRLRALYAAVQGRRAEAARYARSAADLYGKAGSRLYAGHIAALREAVGYEFADDPVAGTERYLRRLAEAYAVEGGPIDPDLPLKGVLGWTRLKVLLAAGREQEAERQIAALGPNQPIGVTLSATYASIAWEFADDARFADDATRWADRAAELAPQLPDAVGISLKFALKRGDDSSAIQIGRRLIDLAGREQADRYLDALQRQYPTSTIWSRLGKSPRKDSHGAETSDGPSTDSSSP